MLVTNVIQQRVIHRFAGILYWSSLLLLLAGVWVLIDPFSWKSGDVSQIYCTLGGFELYVWLLLILGRWQMRQKLTADAARSGIFAVVLTGFFFVALNELHVARGPGAYWISAAAVVLAIAKLSFAGRWLGFPMPKPILVFASLWLLTLAYPAPIFRLIPTDRAIQHMAGYAMCWGLAVLVACHLPLIIWQSARGWRNNGRPLSRWWVPWLILGILAPLATVQIYAVMYGLYVDWAQWYFSPVFLATGVVAVSLSCACGKRAQEAWFAMAIALIHSLVASLTPIPQELSNSWLAGSFPHAVHPLFASGAFVSVVFGAAGLLIARWWLLSLAFVAPVLAGIVEAVRAIHRWPHGRGICMLLGAFLLLGAGAFLQWWQQRRESANKPSIPDRLSTDYGVTFSPCTRAPIPEVPDDQELPPLASKSR